jgi:oxygen-dependent protoporphyrinogen oxidase
LIENMPSPSIAIIGGGISGLSAALHLRKMAPTANIVLIESNDHLGGVLRTDHMGGYLVENSADMFTTEPNTALEFCQRLGRGDELISTQPVPQRAYIATPEGIAAVPRGFSLMQPNDLDAIAESNLLDESGKLRLLEEQRIAARSDESDESLESFAVRRFGQQVFERLIQPLVSGIYTADPKLLSMQATMARFVEMERKEGSLIAAAAASKNQNEHRNNRLAFADQTASGARYDLFRAPKNGMGDLVRWMVDDLDRVTVRTGQTVQRLEPRNARWQLKVDVSEQAEDFDGVILATPARHAGGLLGSFDAKLGKELSSIQAASCAVVVLGFDQQQFVRQFSGYGIVVPSYLNRNLIAASFSSNKFAGRAPEGKVLLRCFIGGAMQEERVDWADDVLVDSAVGELNDWLTIDGRPELTSVYRWRTTMPQYHVGHLDRVAAIRQRLSGHRGLEIAGNSYQGVGIPVCLSGGMRAAESVLQATR